MPLIHSLCEVMMNENLELLKANTRKVLITTYKTNGKQIADNKAKELMLQCEQKGFTPEQRATIKGELSETVLEYHITDLLPKLKNTLVIKGLCIRAIDNDYYTTEIDLVMATPCKVYLFECKSFVGEKVITDKCLLKGKWSEKDVYAQSEVHFNMLDRHICNLNIRSKSPPYKFVLFEFSSDECKDNRTERWKKTVPVISLVNLDEWLIKELSTAQSVCWDFPKLKDKLKSLHLNSAQNFVHHLARLSKKDKWKKE